MTALLLCVATPLINSLCPRNGHSCCFWPSVAFVILWQATVPQCGSVFISLWAINFLSSQGIQPCALRRKALTLLELTSWWTGPGVRRLFSVPLTLVLWKSWFSAGRCPGRHLSSEGCSGAGLQAASLPLLLPSCQSCLQLLKGAQGIADVLRI